MYKEPYPMGGTDGDPEPSRPCRELVDPELCKNCGFRGTPLCTHPDGYYQEEPAGLNRLIMLANERKPEPENTDNEEASEQ